MRIVLSWLLTVLTAIVVTETFASLITSNLWWLQVLNFPRLLMLIIIGTLAVGVAIIARGRWRIVLIAMLGLAAAMQACRIYPYFWIAPIEVADAGEIDRVLGASCFFVLGLNVYQYNRDYAATRAVIDREQPDILLLMETDRSWVDALAPSLARYPSRVMRPLDNTYGLVFATRLPVRSAGTKNITDRDTPTVYAVLETRNGQPFDYIGLHPRPPLPGQGTAPRDRKIKRAALAIANHRLPAIAMGDFNDIAWSRTTQLFKQVGGYLDPRIGRGSYPTFPADYAAIGWPLDQLFMSPGFTFSNLRVLENVGSDHRPLAARICLSGAPARQQNASPDDLTSAASEAAHRMTNQR